MQPERIFITTLVLAIYYQQLSQRKGSCQNWIYFKVLLLGRGHIGHAVKCSILNSSSPSINAYITNWSFDQYCKLCKNCKFHGHIIMRNGSSQVRQYKTSHILTTTPCMASRTNTESKTLSWLVSYKNHLQANDLISKITCINICDNIYWYLKKKNKIKFFFQCFIATQ